jgi:hypothetical protein
VVSAFDHFTDRFGCKLPLVLPSVQRRISISKSSLTLSRIYSTESCFYKLHHFGYSLLKWWNSQFLVCPLAGVWIRPFTLKMSIKILNVFQVLSFVQLTVMCSCSCHKCHKIHHHMNAGTTWAPMLINLGK